MKLANHVVAALAEGAVEVLRPASPSPLLLLCEHAGAEIPAPWDGLGLSPSYLDTHYAYDPGAAVATRHLSEKLEAPAVLSRFSRIFLDYNRFPSDWDHMRPDLGGIPVPGNADISDEDRRLRHMIAVDPVHRATEQIRERCRAVVSIHTFTPVMAGDWRAVDVGILWDQENPFVSIALDELNARGSSFGLRIGDNAPYDLRKVKARSLQTHAADHRLPYFYFEVNNGLFSNPETSRQALSLLDETMNAVLRRRREWDL